MAPLRPTLFIDKKSSSCSCLGALTCQCLLCQRVQCLFHFLINEVTLKVTSKLDSRALNEQTSSQNLDKAFSRAGKAANVIHNPRMRVDQWSKSHFKDYLCQNWVLSEISSNSSLSYAWSYKKLDHNSTMRRRQETNAEEPSQHDESESQQNLEQFEMIWETLEWNEWYLSKITFISCF